LEVLDVILWAAAKKEGRNYIDQDGKVLCLKAT
jgi:hypothetical protein